MTWKGQNQRHSLASRGIKTTLQSQGTSKNNEDKNISKKRLEYWDIELDDILQNEINYIDTTIQADEEDPSEVDFDDLFYSALNLAQQDSNLSEEDYEEVEKLANYYYKEYTRYFHGDRRRPLYS